MGFREDLRTVLNKHNKEIGSNTPDCILEEFLMRCLGAFEKATNTRTEWYKGSEGLEAEKAN